MTTAHIGKPISRVDGRAKVTGTAQYAAEYNAPDLAFGWVITSAVARGKITRIDAEEALALPGVFQVFSHENNPGLSWLGGTAWFDRSYRDELAPPGSPFRPLHDAEVKYSMQPVALVVADTFELARYAASLVRVVYERAPHATDLEAQRAKAYKPKEREGMPPVPNSRGDAEKALTRAAVRHEAEYRAPVEHHNPMEMFATTVVYEEGGKLIVYDKTQGVQNVQGYLCVRPHPAARRPLPQAPR